MNLFPYSNAQETTLSVISVLLPLVLGIISFWPSRRAHWAGPLLASPSVLVGLVVAAAIVKEGFRVLPGILAVCFIYIAVGVSSWLVWHYQRRR